MKSIGEVALDLVTAGTAEVLIQAVSGVLDATGVTNALDNAISKIGPQAQKQLSTFEGNMTRRAEGQESSITRNAAPQDPKNKVDLNYVRDRRVDTTILQMKKDAESAKMKGDSLDAGEREMAKEKYLIKEAGGPNRDYNKDVVLMQHNRMAAKRNKYVVQKVDSLESMKRSEHKLKKIDDTHQLSSHHESMKKVIENNIFPPNDWDADTLDSFTKANTRAATELQQNVANVFDSKMKAATQEITDIRSSLKRNQEVSTDLLNQIVTSSDDAMARSKIDSGEWTDEDYTMYKHSKFMHYQNIKAAEQSQETFQMGVNLGTISKENKRFVKKLLKKEKQPSNLFTGTLSKEEINDLDHKMEKQEGPTFLDGVRKTK